jgi:UPF0716 family protein affecting phage T7 exclusion
MGVQITLVVVIVATVVGVVLVRPALARTRTTARL